MCELERPAGCSGVGAVQLSVGARFSTNPNRASVSETDLWKPKTGDPNYWTAGQSLFAQPAELFTQSRAVSGGTPYYLGR